jgi:hypothetical protein
VDTSVRESEQRGVSLGGAEAKLGKKRTETRIPSARRLLQTVESSLQLAHVVRIPSILKTRRLLHIDILSEMPMKKRITDINLSKCPSSRDSQRENKANGG